jgi:hypothetical protein
MALHKLWTKDVARGRYTSLNQSQGAATAVNTVDGNPSTLWYPLTAQATWQIDLGANYYIAGAGVANHNLSGGTISLVHSANGTTGWTSLGAKSVATGEDVLIGMTTPVLDRYWRVVCDNSAGSGAQVVVGIISLLIDYGRNAANVLQTSGGFGVLALGNEGGVRRQIGRSVIAPVGAVDTVGGAAVQQISSAPFETIVLQCVGMRTGADLEWWRVRRSFKDPGSSTTDPTANPGWAKGLWYTGDEHVMDAASPALYCEPMDDLQDPIEKPGGRVAGVISLRQRPVGA